MDQENMQPEVIEQNGQLQQRVSGQVKKLFLNTKAALVRMADGTPLDQYLAGLAENMLTQEALDEVLGGAPEALDTLKELADALGGDPDFAASITEALAGKADAEEGKGLSAEDFTAALKAKLESMAAVTEPEKARWSAGVKLYAGTAPPPAAEDLAPWVFSVAVGDGMAGGSYYAYADDAFLYAGGDQGANLLGNPGFEDPGDSGAGWDLTGGQAGAGTDAATSHSGSARARLGRNASMTASIAGPYDYADPAEAGIWINLTSAADAEHVTVSLQRHTLITARPAARTGWQLVTLSAPAQDVLRDGDLFLELEE
jgi:hypothetical protein